jgi:hypothetical protein
MLPNFFKRCCIAGVWCLIDIRIALAVYPTTTPSQAISKENGDRQPYETWSLFLICNPTWILQYHNEGIKDLYKAFLAFGRVIGPNNLAVWFVKETGQIPSVDNTDIERMSDYCKKFGLLPSKTPQVVTLTGYPDDNVIGAKFLTNLNGSADESERALTELTDELVKTGLTQPSMSKESYWSKLVESASVVMSRTSCYLNKVSFSIDAGFFKAEIAHEGDKADKGC